MRLVKLSVQRFQCIEAADVEFGPGLNVLYGPNDTGKSSLAAAIRAVLLLQHGSTQHERFVSWYGGGEPPRVALTFADATDRYWRIAKTFAGAAARTVLEESRDGRTFTGGVNGRAADEKLRQMLGWGMHTPGGQGGPRGVPDTFLIQVLLAEQDDLRKIFASSLGDDPDDSGRTRLTDALGALAQDPLFKKVLLRAQAQHDRAFTGTGRKKRAAGSPFVEIDTRIKELDRERDELEGKVRATTVAEDAIGSLLRQRDALDADLREGREALAAQQALVAVQAQRAAVEAEITQHLVTIEGAAELQDAIATTTAQLSALQADGEARTTRVEAARARATHEEAARDRAREAYEALTSEPAVDHARGALVDAHARARDGLAAATTAAAQASAALATATSASKTLADAIAAHDVAAMAAGDAEGAATTAATTLDAARRALADAEQRVREATSADQARARELRRSELENQRLTCLADRPGHQAALLHVRAIRTALAEAATATATCATLDAQAAAARHASELATTAVAAIEAEHDGLVGLQRCGQASALRERLAVAEQHAEEARVLAVRARALRDDERVLRGGLRAGLPTTAAIAALRRLRDELRIAEAKVEVGLAVVVRPRRPLAIRSRVDGGQEVTSPPLAEPRAFTAKRAATIAIDDLVEIEISAGDEAARANVAALRTRWEAEGTRVLQAHGIETVEALEAVRTQADADERVADALGKDAAAAEQHAAQLAGLATDAGELRAQLASVEQELVGIDRQALEASFARLGSSWHVAIKTSLAAIERRRRPAAEAVDGARATLARLDAQLDAQRATAAAAMRTAQELAAASPGEVDEREARSTEALDEIEREVRNLDGILARLSNDASGEEAAARTALATATTAVTVVGEANAQRATAATTARGAVIQAETRVEGARAQARALDVHGAWDAALDGRVPLALDAWATLRAAAADALVAARTALDAAGVALARFDEARAATLKAAREVRDTADTSARAARLAADQLVAAQLASSGELERLRDALVDMRTRAASANLPTARAAIDALRVRLTALGPAIPIDPVDLEHQRWSVEQLELKLGHVTEDLARSRGALEQVGGAIVRERAREIAGALAQAHAREREVGIEFEAWRMLVDTLKETESTEGAHLGRALAVPVSQRFRELTGGRYGELALGAHLEAQGIQAAGELRDLDVLSAGTQDQLATLLRLCLAEQLRTSIVLDDHLSQTDPERVRWFNAVLRTAAQEIQVVLITCRPSEVLGASELPVGTDAVKVAAAGQLHAIDLARVVRRFGASQPRIVPGG